MDTVSQRLVLAVDLRCVVGLEVLSTLLFVKDLAGDRSG